MGFIDLFVKTDDDDAAEKAVKEASKQASKPAPTSVSSLTANAAPTAAYVPPVVVSNEAKSEFATFIDDIYKKGNFPGPDYQEFTDALKAMESTPLDEKTKFTAVFAGFKVQGVTKSRLLDTAGKYIAMINEQTAGFGKKIEDILQSEVAQKQKNVDTINKDNAEIEKQMIALTERKSKNNEIIAATTAEISAQVSTLTAKKTSFEAAAGEFIGKVNQNITKINDYLPA